jgi:hypothetical protein
MFHIFFDFYFQKNLDFRILKYFYSVTSSFFGVFSSFSSSGKILEREREKDSQVDLDTFVNETFTSLWCFEAQVVWKINRWPQILHKTAIYLHRSLSDGEVKGMQVLFDLLLYFFFECFRNFRLYLITIFYTFANRISLQNS